MILIRIKEVKGILHYGCGVFGVLVIETLYPQQT